MKIFVSFDFENDRQYKYILNSWNANPHIKFDFDDGSTREINSWNISRVKASITNKIRQADCLLVIVGRYADSFHKDKNLIGHKNWQHFEISKAIEAGKIIVAVKLDKSNPTPPVLYSNGVSWAMSFSLESIKTAIQKVQYGRKY